jgi:lysophospholipase L1-like esterase
MNTPADWFPTLRLFRDLAADTASSAPDGAPPPARIPLRPGSVLLFQGDSITDADHDRNCPGPNDPRNFARGYAAMVMAHLLDRHAGLGLVGYNRGIAGDKIPQLQARWDADCLALKPDVLSLLAGVNDMYHKMDNRYDGTIDDYERGLRSLVETTRRALPAVALVLGEPFALRCGHVTARWFPEFDARRAAARRVAERAGAVWVPFQSAFDRALSDRNPATYWTSDGIHPTPPGHALMAQAWLAATGLA